MKCGPWTILFWSECHQNFLLKKSLMFGCLLSSQKSLITVCPLLISAQQYARNSCFS